MSGINKSLLQAALAKFNDDGRIIWCTGELEQLHATIRFNLIRQGSVVDQRVRQVAQSLDYAHHDHWNMYTTITRLEWMKELFAKGLLNEGYWMEYARADIDIFHVEFRSLFDYLAKILRLVQGVSLISMAARKTIEAYDLDA